MDAAAFAPAPAVGRHEKLRGRPQKPMWPDYWRFTIPARIGSIGWLPGLCRDLLGNKVAPIAAIRRTATEPTGSAPDSRWDELLEDPTVRNCGLAELGGMG
jgi:hypothetical protein